MMLPANGDWKRAVSGVERNVRHGHPSFILKEAPVQPSPLRM
jgi:hypothetical protein